MQRCGVENKGDTEKPTPNLPIVRLNFQIERESVNTLKMFDNSGFLLFNCG